MCAYSFVGPQYDPLIPFPTSPFPFPNTAPITPWGPVPSTGEEITPANLEALLKAFWASVKAAKEADKAAGQPDCTDPAKIKLEARVAELERRLDAMAKPKTKKPAKKTKLSGKAASR